MESKDQLIIHIKEYIKTNSCLIDAPAGCGKSQCICESIQDRDLILCPTNAGV